MRVHYLWFGALIILAINVVASTFSTGEYLVQFGGFRFPAQNPYKPILLLNGAFIVYFLLSKQGTDTNVEERGRLAVPFILLLACLVGFVYSPAIAVNFSHQDWTHRHMGARLNSWSAVWRLFVDPQPDGMYRPLAFLSFALDYQLFGPTLWGYHLQSIGLHVLNSILAGMLAIRLGLGVWTGRVAALLFGVSACHFEAVLWPAARFDLLATAFGAISLLLFMKHWETIGERSWWFGGLGLLSYGIAVLNKETAYSIVLIVPLLIAFLKLGGDQRRRAASIIPALLGCTVALVAVRFAVLGGIGGYAGNVVSFKSFYSMVVNSLALSVFGINTTLESSLAKWIVVLYAGLIILWAMAYRKLRSSAIPTLALLAIVSAVPAISVIGWINPSLQHTRNLYWPSIWMAMFLALVLEGTSRRTFIAAVFVAIQISALSFNIWVYQDLLGAVDKSVAVVRGGVGPATEVILIGVPAAPNGVFYFGSELEERVRREIPQIAVRTCAGIQFCEGKMEQNEARFQWDSKSRLLKLMTGIP